MSQHTSIFAAGAFVALSIAVSPVSAASGRVIHDLGTLGGSSSFARGINDRGQVVGESSTTSRTATGAVVSHAFLYTSGQQGLRDLGSPNGGDSGAVAISDSGLVAGTSRYADTNVYCARAVVWNILNRSVAELPDLHPASIFGCSNPSDVNDRGQIVGSSDNTPVIWENGTVRSLGTLGGQSGFATSINQRGSVVGQSATASGDLHGFIWRHGVMTDLGTLGGSSITVSGINDRDQVVGYGTDANNNFVPFVWENGVFTKLPSLGGYANARAISDAGFIAGEASVDFGNALHAVLWDRQRNVIDLGALPNSTFSSATDVSSSGAVAGISYVTDNQGGPGGYHAVIWN